MNFGSPPSADEIEVSLVGPGYGEGIILHLGQNDWVVIDSCLNKSKAPAPLEYLCALGLDPSEVIKAVVATHWHDDHVGGLGAVFRESKQSKFVCSDALRSEEFLTLVRASRSRSMMVSSGVKEFNDVMDVLEERSTRNNTTSPTWAIADRVIWARPKGTGASFSAQILSLSPSDTSITLAKKEIASLIPSIGGPKMRVSPRPPNHTAVVLWIKVGNSSILLGSDLEVTSNQSTGWTAILNSQYRSTERASVFKVAHHGSVTAYESRIWNEMLDPEPVATLTPFIRGKTALPKKDDAARICGHTSKSFSTASTKVRERKGRPQVVSKTIKETVQSIREVPAATGLIRLRKRATEPSEGGWRVELFGTAMPLQDLCV